MEFVNEIRRAETTSTAGREFVWYEQKLAEIIIRLNSMPKDMRIMIVGALLYELLACTNIKTLERSGLLEETKKLF